MNVVAQRWGPADPLLRTRRYLHEKSFCPFLQFRQFNEGCVSYAQALCPDSSNGLFATVAKLSLRAQTLLLLDAHFAENCYRDSAIRFSDTSFITLSELYVHSSNIDKSV